MPDEIKMPQMIKATLLMLETVSITDTFTLDIIDARVNGVLCGGIFIDFRKGAYGQEVAWYSDAVWRNREHPDPTLEFEDPRDNIKQYTRSRDALKALRLKEWDVYDLGQTGCGGSWSCTLNYGGSDRRTSLLLRTEEFAELHAILQTYLWKEENND